MRAFRFRAAAVLDLRVRQEEEAAKRLSLAQTALEDARRALLESEARLGVAMSDYEAVIRRGADGGVQGWHRLWITRLRMEGDSKRTAVSHRVADVERATRTVQDAHRARRVMERLRDRALARYTQDERRTTTRELDMLSTIRFATRDTH